MKEGIDQVTEDCARAVALSSPSNFRVGCLLLSRGKVLVSSTNTDIKTHPIQAHFASRAGLDKKVYLHAEVRALLKPWASRCDTLVVCRVNKKGELCMARPCPVCQLAIAESSIKRVYYSTNQGDWEILRLI